MSQTVFWARAGLSTSGGSRLESKDAPLAPETSILLTTAYGPEMRASRLVTFLRGCRKWKNRASSPAVVARFVTPEEIRAFRDEQRLLQEQFWGQIEVSQPRGSHYEVGIRSIPRDVQLVLTLTYGTHEEAAATVAALRCFR